MNDATIHPDQAQLLLYLAGELSPQDRRAIEARLAGDAMLRQQLEDLSRIEGGVNQSLSAADAADLIDSRLPAIERHLSKTLAQWQVDRLTSNAPVLARTRIRRVPVWMYPLAAAAIVMVGLGFWWLTLESLPDGVVERPTNAATVDSQNPRGAGFFGDPDGDFDLALNDLGSETYDDLEREMATFQTLNETLQ